MKIYMNGKMVPEKEAKVSVFDHGLLYGDGVFEGIRAYNGRVFMLEEHIDRLYRSAKAIALEIPMTQGRDGARPWSRPARPTGAMNGYIRLVVTRGVGTLGLNPYTCKKPQVIIIAAAIQLYPAGAVREGADDRDRGHDPQPHGVGQPRDQEPELPEQHPGQDRGDQRRRAWKRSCSTRRATWPRPRATTSSSSRATR